MSPTKIKHQSAVGQTGWAAFDWNYSETGPQLTFVAGSCDAARVQMDRYRRDLQGLISGNQWFVVAWSTRDFFMRHRRSGTVIFTQYANIKPQKTPPIDVAVLNMREGRFVTGIPTAYYLNRLTTQVLNVQSDNVFGMQAAIMRPTLPGPTGTTQFFQFGQDSGFATIRVVIFGLHNVGWGISGGFP